MQELTAVELKQKIEQGENFVLDLYATWCGPCKIMLANLERVNESLLSESVTTSYNIYKYDIDSDYNFSVTELKIRSVPTIKIFKEGKEVFSRVGVMSTNEVINEMSKN